MAEIWRSVSLGNWLRYFNKNINCTSLNFKGLNWITSPKKSQAKIAYVRTPHKQIQSAVWKAARGQWPKSVPIPVSYQDNQ
jgi:hypothetical protein